VKTFDDEIESVDAGREHCNKAKQVKKKFFLFFIVVLMEALILFLPPRSFFFLALPKN